MLGAPGEGKSKALELLIRQDIDRGYGCCLLDPGRNASTAYKVLRYCASIGHEKVCLIDPHDWKEKLCTINPITNAPASVVASNLMDTMRILWADKHEGTAKISKYLPAIFKAIHKSQLTLHETLYFTDQNHPVYKHRRNILLDNLHPLDRDRVILESAFTGSRSLFNLEVDSTVRRLNPLFDDTLKLMLGSNESPLNFMKMISEGWVILCNLDPIGVWAEEQTKFLGTLILNEILQASSRLQAHALTKPYYVYLDEVGLFANPKLAYILDYGRHSALRFAFAHQRFDQIPEEFRSAIFSAKTKMLFNTPIRADRDQMIRMMYGGELPDRTVSYELMNLPKQHAAIKINKNPPRITRLPDLPDVQISMEELVAFKESIYRQDWYFTREEILNEINARFKSKEPAPILKQRTTYKGSVEATRGRQGKGKAPDHVSEGTVPYNRPDSPNVLRRSTGRSTRKVDPNKT